jgi:hypothetical protein
MATVAIPITDAPYCTLAAGPTSHSPPPIAVARRMAPGPITRKALAAVNGGGSGRSATLQGGNPPARRLAERSSVAIAMGGAL